MEKHIKALTGGVMNDLIGTFTIVAGTCYLKVNEKGTLEKLPKLKWYHVLYFYFKSRIKGWVSVQEIRKMAKGKNEWRIY